MPGPSWPSGSRRASASASGHQTAPSGDHAVRDEQDRRDPRQHQPELSAERGAVRAPAVRGRWLVIAPEFKTSDYTGMIHELAPELGSKLPGRARGRGMPDLRGVIRLGEARLPGMSPGQSSWRGAAAVSAEDLMLRQREQEFDDAINIQYTPARPAPEGRDAHPSQHPEQRLLRRRELCASRTDDRLCIPVPLYHCFGMVHGQSRLRDARRDHGVPGESFDARRARGGRRRSAARRSTACRRCSSPSSSIPSSRVSTSPSSARGSWPARPARSR